METRKNLLQTLSTTLCQFPCFDQWQNIITQWYCFQHSPAETKYSGFGRHCKNVFIYGYEQSLNRARNKAVTAKTNILNVNSTDNHKSESPTKLKNPENDTQTIK